jgi:hypothetical protein
MTNDKEPDYLNFFVKDDKMTVYIKGELAFSGKRFDGERFIYNHLTASDAKPMSKEAVIEAMAATLRCLFPNEAYSTYIRASHCVLHQAIESRESTSINDIEAAIVKNTSDRIVNVMTPDELTLIAKAAYKALQQEPSTNDVECVREAFERDAEPYGYDMTIGNKMHQFTRGDVPFVYADEATNHRWLGFLAALTQKHDTPAIEELAEENKRLREALENLLQVGYAYQTIQWEDDCEGDNWDETIEIAEQALAGIPKEEVE